MAAEAGTATAATATAPPRELPGARRDLRLPDEWWEWRGHRIRYQSGGGDAAGAGDEPAIVMVHGFGGNADHWVKNARAVAESTGRRVFTIDLLGYGYSDQPVPAESGGVNALYNFENWGAQLVDFAREVAGGPVLLVCNSVGGVAGLQAAVDGGDEAVRAVLCLNISLRGLNVRRQPPLVSKAVGVLQKVLRETPVGEFFYAQIAQPRALRNVLREAYADPATVDDDLVDRMLQPGLRPGSAAVFLDFISYSTGPLPEDLLEKLPKEKVMFGWGTKDPWELVDMGREYYADMVREFVELEGLGHCPMDEAPQIVNPLIERFVREY